MALGEMGLEPESFYRLTPRQFNNKLTGFRRAQDATMREGWEQARHIMWAVLAPHQKQGSNMTPQKLLEFPWEKPAKEQQLLELQAMEKEVESVREFYRRFDAKKAEKVILNDKL